MKSPLEDGLEWLELAEADSTQNVAADRLRSGSPVGVVFARNQSRGRGRFGRVWESSEGDSLTFSMIFRAYAGHPRPHLIGMAVALAAAEALDCGLRWPNDLVLGQRKLGGLLTELLPDEKGDRVPVVGVGVNLNQCVFPPEIEEIATSLALARGGTYSPQVVGRRIADTLATLPEPESWSDLAPRWARRDQTPGKRYLLFTGEVGIGVQVGPQGELLCQVGNEVRTVLAADALFGPK